MSEQLIQPRDSVLFVDHLLDSYAGDLSPSDHGEMSAESVNEIVVTQTHPHQVQSKQSINRGDEYPDLNYQTQSCDLESAQSPKPTMGKLRHWISNLSLDSLRNRETPPNGKLPWFRRIFKRKEKEEHETIIRIVEKGEEDEESIVPVGPPSDCIHTVHVTYDPTNREFQVDNARLINFE